MIVTGMPSQADRPHSARTEPDRPLVSVVVTTYARERLDDVKNLLGSLANQTYTNVEVIFIGERVRELSTLVADQAARSGITDVRIVFNDHPGLSRSRNLGAQLARGEIVAFIDDDALALDDWVKEIVKVFAQNPAAIGVAGTALPLWEEAAMAWFPEEFFWIISCPVPAWTGVSRLQPVRNAWGINMAFRKEAFAVCRFSEVFGVSNRGQAEGVKLGLSGDDTEFCLHLRYLTGRPILFNPDCKVLHGVKRQRLSARFTRRQAFWDGYTKATIGRVLGQYGDGNARFLLSNELTFLRQTLVSFLPRVIREVFRSPRVAARQLALAVDVLVHFALGYAAARLPWPGTTLARLYSH
jgi:glycosyltransferase involved in cell wall biosynthesis